VRGLGVKLPFTYSIPRTSAPMTKKTSRKTDKSEELVKYRDLIIATLDYYIENKIMDIKTTDFDSLLHFKSLKIKAADHFEKGRLTILKQMFRDMSEMQIEIRDFKFNAYLREKTGIDIDIFQNYFERITKIIKRGKITTDNQFYDVKNMVDHLCQTDPVDHKQIDILNKLMTDYEQIN
jgi:hypothetical protein